MRRPRDDEQDAGPEVVDGEIVPADEPPAALLPAVRWPEPASGRVGDVLWAWLVDAPIRAVAYLGVWLLDSAAGTSLALVLGWIAGLLLIVTLIGVIS